MTSSPHVFRKHNPKAAPEAFKDITRLPYRAQTCIAKSFRVTQIFLLRNIKQQIEISDWPASYPVHFVIFSKIARVWTPSSAGGSRWSPAILPGPSFSDPSLKEGRQPECRCHLQIFRVSPGPFFSLFMCLPHIHKDPSTSEIAIIDSYFCL